jgi:aspartate aminotransferase
MALGISYRARRITPSPTLSISAKAKEMRNAGVDVIDLSVGEPDFDTPMRIKNAAVEAIMKGFTKYTPASGIPELREAVAEKLERENGLRYDPSEIVISCGAKHVLANIFQAICDDGDEVIIISPYWASYAEQVRLANGIPVFVEAREEDMFVPDPDLIRAKVSGRTKAILVNSPCNPTGAVYGEDVLEEIGRIGVENEVYIISDEIYEKIVYDGVKVRSMASLGEDVKERTILVNGVSKTYAMTGWRIGYAAGPKEIISAIANIQSQTTSNPTSIAQFAALEAIRGDDGSEARMMVEEFARRRKAIVEGLRRIPGISVCEPKGAFYVFPNFSSFIGRKAGGRVLESSTDISQYLLERAAVATVPGADFGSDSHIRFSFAASIERIEEGIERVSKALDSLD